MPGRDLSPTSAEDIAAIEREIRDLFQAARRRNAEHAARVARELGLDRLAERFLAEAAELEREAADDEKKDCLRRKP